MPIGQLSSLPIPTGVVTYRAYRHGSDISAGLVDVKLPDIKFLTQSVGGPGILGNIETVMPLIDAMTATMKWRVMHEEQFELLNSLRQHGLAFRVAQEYYDTGAGGPSIDGWEVRLKAAAKGLNLGAVANAGATDSEIEVAVYYLRVRNAIGAIMCEVDPANYVLNIGGVDMLASLRAAL